MNPTFQQVVDFLGLTKEQAKSLIDDLAARFPDGAVPLDQFWTVVAPFVTPENIANRVKAGVLEGLNTVREGHGAARVNPTAHFI